ncbi:helix-turn-helix transcriptional regulator [Brevibacillus choshinensis]|uniref:helix-turn-helix transcriptional regulator n=1 Tax=Brevibacillus choshinensis TaxID=54911 RepID=UPI002E20BABA|nr:helix-turn-helix transcriptional regulator [Brevibacillus choshinensis]
MEAFSNQDYQKVLAFMDDMVGTTENFRQQALQSFERRFGFQRANFWMANEHEERVRPVMRNIDRNAMDSYLAACYQHDILLPSKVVDRLGHQHVLRIHDVLSPHEYEQSDYYHEFMARHGYYHQMVAYLMNNGKLLGSIAFVRSKKESPFQERDIRCMEIISRFLSRTMIQYERPKRIASSKPQQETDLTAKEREVLALVQKGFGNEAIAAQMFVSINTVKKHLQSIYRKFDVTNRTSLCYKILAKESGSPSSV